VFVTSLGDFVAPSLLGGPSSRTIAQVIYDQFLRGSRNWGFGAALSMLLIMAVSVAIALLLKYGDRRPDQYS
jgi:spermidine/putrescine transport system permease protein